jgi:antitoxin component of MazEF toxin-antitoxin module
MEVTISIWGNSLGLRIPKKIAKSIGIGSHSKVRLELKGGSLVVSPADESTFLTLSKGIRLKSMVKRVTRKNLPSPSETEDVPVGDEVW